MTDTPDEDKPEGAEATDTPLAATLRFKDFVDLVAETSGVNRREVRPVLEAALGVLNSRLKTGQVLVLPPLGRLRVVKEAVGVRTIKLRDLASAGGAKAAKHPLAGADD